ncbi:MAG: patatin-like phospholipase family protein [Sulfurimonadaceae bacterium]
MSTKTFVLSLSLYLVLGAAIHADDQNYTVSDEKINAISVIPKNDVKGINAFKGTSKQVHTKQSDSFDELDLATHGNKDAAFLSGLNVDANKPTKHEDGYKRPRIGLVLSGGGARGGAHLGVIKAFEHHNIPIDAIVGTSMGSFVGGLYAAGMSSNEIERQLTTMDWTKVITFDYDRTQIPFRRKKLQRAFPGNAMVGINADEEIVFGTGLFKRQNMLKFLKSATYNVSNIQNFDDLRIPFRAVASRLEDGATVVLRGGSLAKSIYASIAIPGGFDPITINGEVLVDGGVADNLPLDVMREEMNVDYIVVVDISTPYDEHAKFDNYISVMGQLVNILMRKNVEDTIKSMEGRDNEVLVVPDLTGYGPLDADKYPQIIAIGESKAEEVYNSDLSQLSLYEKEYYQYLADRPKPKKYVAPVIDKIKIDNATYLNDEKILSLLHIQLGEPLDHKQLDKDIESIYNLMVFDDVSYKVEEENGIHVLHLITTPSWDVNGQIKFAIGFEDNFNGHSDYSIKLEYRKFGLNSYAGEWRTRLEFGQQNLLYTELYQPIDPYGNFYVRPTLFYNNEKLYVTPELLLGGIVTADLDQSTTIQAREYGGSFGLGVNITNDLRVEAGGILKHVNPSTDLLLVDSVSGVATYETFSAEGDVYNIYAQVEYDSLDNAFFPRSGHRAYFKYLYTDQFSDPTAQLSQYFIDMAGAYTFGRHTFSPRLEFGQTFDTTDLDRSQDFSNYYTLGGLFKLSGLPTNAITGNNSAFAAVVYRYRLSEDGFFGSLSMPLYAGMSIETGSAWYGTNNFSTDMLLYSGSAYLAADTILGPFYLAAGTTEFDYYSIYISLGKSF